MHQPSWSYASSITQPSWRCSSSIYFAERNDLRLRSKQHWGLWLTSEDVIKPLAEVWSFLIVYRLFVLSRISLISNAILNATEVWSTSITKYHTLLTPKCPSWLSYLRFSVIENQSLRSTCKIKIQSSVTFVHPSQCTKAKAFDHKITRWRYLCFTFIANTTTAVVHRSSHSFNGVV